MPIAPETRWLYPIDWREPSALIRFTRANGRCERCGLHQATGGWTASLGILAAIAVVGLFAGVIATRDVTLEDRGTGPPARAAHP